MLEVVLGIYVFAYVYGVCNVCVWCLYGVHGVCMLMPHPPISVLAVSLRYAYKAHMAYGDCHKANRWGSFPFRAGRRGKENGKYRSQKRCCYPLI